MGMLNSGDIARKLQTRFGLGISGGIEEVDGGTFVVLRPTDLERPNGFGIVLGRTSRQMEASFRADTFTRSLLRQMAEADDEARASFATLLRKAVADGYRVNISVNGIPIDSMAELPKEEWAKLELDCDKRVLGGRLTSDQAQDFAIEVASTCLGLVLSLLPVEETSDSLNAFETGLPEGAKIQVLVNKYERSPANRAACISHFGTKCQVCGFDFAAHYGVLGQDFIEVHHVVPVSLMGGVYSIDPVRDLTPVCGNCHAMLHRKNPPYSVSELRTVMEKLKSI
jgi:5-methylcytosine-specific restriction protein A